MSGKINMVIEITDRKYEENHQDPQTRDLAKRFLPNTFQIHVIYT